MQTVLIALAGVQLTLALLILFLLVRSRNGEWARLKSLDSVVETVRTEADRVRNDAKEHSDRARQGIDEAVQRFQDSLLNRLDVAIENIRHPITGIGQKLDIDIAKMGHEAREGRDTLRGTIEAKLDAHGDRQATSAKDLRTELVNSFDRTTANISQTMKDLGTHQSERLEKVALELKAMSDRQSTAQETLRQSVEGRLDAIRQENATKLDEMRRTVDDKLQNALEKRLTESFRTVSEQLERVHSGLGEMQTLANGVGDLKRVLSNVKVRGTIAEGQLASLLEQFLAPDQFIANAKIKDGSSERVEFAIKLPGDELDLPILLPIDAKFPTEDYDRLVAAADCADVEALERHARALELRVRESAKSISEKYISPPVTTDYAILFLPTEGLFAEVLRRPGLHERLQRDYRVIIAGPTTLCALLSSFQMGFRSRAIHARSSEVWKILGAVKSEFAQHGKVVDELKRQLGTAANTIDRLGTRTRAMNRALQGVEVVSSSSTPALLGLDETNQDSNELAA